VALSVGRPRGLAACVYPRITGVTRHRALRCSDFPPPTCAGSGPPPFQNHCEANPEGVGWQDPWMPCFWFVRTATAVRGTARV